MHSAIPKSKAAVFGPEIIASMAAAFEDVCRALNINGNVQEREILATRIVDLARDGEHDRRRLRERILWGIRPATDVL